MSFLRSLIPSNPYFGKSKMDRNLVIVFFCGIHLGFWYEAFHVMPQYNIESSYKVTAHYVMAVVFFCGALSNLYKVIVTRTDCTLFTLSHHEEQRDWPYCERCSIYQPPRSHHCRICDVCVLQRDHHCYFSGCCIGHANYRYYLGVVAYMFLAAVYANLFHFQFSMERLGHLGWMLPICLIIPHISALFGYLTLYEFLLLVMSFLGIFCAIMFAWLVKIQVTQLMHGQLHYERKKGIYDYDYGFFGNMKAVMGQRWYVAWISPWISSPLPGDGISFPPPKMKLK